MPMNPRLLRPRAPSGFNPRTIAGLALWLDASDSATLGPASSGPGTVSNNSPLKYWGDKSGNGRHATQAGADSASPSYLVSGIGGKPALSFDGTVKSIDGTLSTTLTAETVFLVATLRSGGTSAGRLFTQSDASADATTAGHYVPLLRNDLTEAISSYATSGFRASLAVTYNSAAVLISRHTGAQIQNSVNNGAAQTYSHTLNKTFTRYRLGLDFSVAGRLDGLISEVLVYSRSVSDAERNAVAAYLGRKYGIVVS